MPMSDKKRWIRLAVAAGLGAAAGAWTYQIQKDKKAKNDARLAVVEAAVVRSRDYGKQKAYIVGNSLSSLAAAVWLIKDCHFPGSSIMVYGENEEACGNAGPLVVSRENCEDFLELCGKLPGSGEKVFTFPKTEGGECLGCADLPALWRLLCTEEERLDVLSVEDWFSGTPHIFETDLWQLCQCVFGLKKDSSLAEFRRSLWELKGPFLFLSPEERQELIRLLKQYLRRKGVLLLENTQVTDLELENGNGNGSGTGLAVKKLYVKRRLQEEETDREAFVFEKIDLRSGDVCIMDNGSGSGKLWKKAADLHIALGEPEAFVGEDGELMPLRPHHFTDRPKTVPTGSRNLGFVGAFSRLEEGCCLTGNYAVASARSAVDELMHVGKRAAGIEEKRQSRIGKWITVYKVVCSLYRADL